MKRFALVLAAALLVFAQSSRDAYRNAYQAWRQAAPALERDAAQAGPALGADADRVANAAAKYGTARGAFLSQAAAEQEQSLAWLGQTPPASLDVPDGAPEVIAAETTAVRRNIDTFAGDPDPGMQQLRGMLERENTALGSLASSVEGTHKASESASAAAAAAVQARMAAITAAHDVIAGLKGADEESVRETAAWAEYYRTLSDGARGVFATPPAPANPTGNSRSAPEPIERRPSITPLPLGRYTGAWTFPVTNGLFHGSQPEFVDMVVHEENGHAFGTLFGRFKVASGDPVLRFDFTGDFKDSRNQTFPLVTSDGAKGTLELIPGAAFNLLEINFQIEPKPDKIHQGNLVLVKK